MTQTAVALYPLRFAPLIKETLWGGRNLERLFGKELPPDVTIGETWEVYIGNKVSNGGLAGKTLAEVTFDYGAALLGDHVFTRYGADFPLLFKFLDAHQSLSVQVHPDDEFARAQESVPFGKAEMWYVLHNEPGAQIVHGVEDGTTREHLLMAAAGGEAFQRRLAHVGVQSGDVINIPTGTVHALGAGIIVYEVQQSCDVTYRLYDWDRLDAHTGQPRTLYVEKAAHVADLSPAHVNRSRAQPIGEGRSLLVASPHFRVELLEPLDQTITLPERDSFAVFTTLEGRLTVGYAGGAETIGIGESLLMPASLGALTASGMAKAVYTTSP